MGRTLTIEMYEADGELKSLFGSHWGSGIVLLDRDRLLIRRALANAFQVDRGANTKKKGTLNHLFNLLLRSFFFGRTYMRCFSVGAYKGYKTRNVAFIHDRFTAIKGIYNHIYNISDFYFQIVLGLIYLIRVF